ncbi:hypothetical protein [Emticicia sp. C21]|uniref:hypothetical protein n=1 Tax=Emticicia sp. C21 TaxID=2302915 RepID=UPI000E34C3B6|nr:hypothetical protein [Emticicia sp. C21]RFS15061.1 hypothetical protein D0T08_18460 [Emticicia sp. C21]
MEKEKMNAGGRGITDYKPEYDEQAYNYCLLGATNETLAEFFGVSDTTIKKWMKKYPGFQESVRNGKELADMQVARSLFRRAVGYTYEQVVSEFVRVADNQEEPEKVNHTVRTFLHADSNGSQKSSLATIQGELEKVTNTVGTYLNENNNSVQKSSLTTIQEELEKVINMVKTFVNADSDGLQKISTSTTQTEPEKVTHTVETFLDEERKGLQKSSATTTQTEPEKVTNTVGTFLNEEREGLQKIRVTTREVIPDVRAQIFWLKNRQPKLWRDKQEIDHTTKGEKMSYVKIFELPDDGRNDYSNLKNNY